MKIAKNVFDNKLNNSKVISSPVSKISIDFKKMHPGSLIYEFANKFKRDHEK
jgi:hypothetical protein